jgi:hypothetical protein
LGFAEVGGEALSGGVDDAGDGLGAVDVETLYPAASCLYG